jgi:hypothetical protein
MLYNSEEAFIDKFIACLKLKQIPDIPFDNKMFYAGVENMRQYFQTNRDELGDDASEISLLFIKNPMEGIYSRFRDAISEQNGWFISFENPAYEKGILKISEKDARKILEDDDLTMPIDKLQGFADVFCEGAELLDD